MSYIALYRKWRPLLFEDVVEQSHVVQTLKNAITNNRIAHAYLFCGTRGTGKTTMAKIFSRAINCLASKDGDPCNKCEICKGILNGSILDVIEIDAASNNSVDNVREIRDEIVYTPTKAKYKVYIIDEVHMLSMGAFNALLKTLEEPPEHAVFILATTEPHKLPATILSRCQRYDFRRISTNKILDRLKKISEASEVELETEAGKLIARLSEGALRDAISILDQCISLGNKKICQKDVLDIIGIVNDELVSSAFQAIETKNGEKIFTIVEEIFNQGKDIKQFVTDLILYHRNVLLCSISKTPENLIDLPLEWLSQINEVAKRIDKNTIIYRIKELSILEGNLKWSSNQRILLEVGLIKLFELNMYDGNEEIAGRMDSLEKKIEQKNLTIQSTVVSVKKDQNTEKIVKKDEIKTKKKTLNIESMDCWNDIVEQVKASYKMSVYTCLIDSKAIMLGEKQVGIIFPDGNNFQKTLVSSPENTILLEKLFSDRIGYEIKIKYLFEEDIIDEAARINKNDDESEEFCNNAIKFAEKMNATINFIDE